MILYQLAKRLEQRKQLHQTIGRTEGNVQELVMQKEKVEEQLYTQANMWSADGQDEFLLAGLTPDTEIAQNSYL